MKILGIDFSRFFSTRDLPAAEQRGFVSAADWLKGETGGDAPVLASAYEQVVWVYRAINVLAEQVANVPFRFSLADQDGDHLITTGPLIDFYSRPHPMLNQFQYWELRVIWLMLRGECFRVPMYRPGPDGRPVIDRVLLLDPARFQHIVREQELVGWRYSGLGPDSPLASQVFLPEEVWFERLPHPFDFWRGLSPLAVAANATRMDFAAGAFMKGLMENNGDNGLIIRTEQQIDPKQREQLMAALRERKRRAGQADRPLLLWSGAEVVEPSLSSSDLQFLENRKFSRAEICAAFGVPEEVITTTDTAKYDVMAGARLNFIENRVLPLCRRLEAEERVTVRSLDPRAVGWFDTESLPIMQQARRNRLATARDGFEMGVPFNELNRVFDLGFRPLPWGNRGYLAGGLVAQGEMAAPVKSKGENLQEAFPPLDTFERMIALFATLPNNLPSEGQRPDNSASSKLKSKLRRFRFEQRSRVLNAVKALAPPAPGSDSRIHLAQIFNVAEESLQLERVLNHFLTANPAMGSRAIADSQSAAAGSAPVEVTMAVAAFHKNTAEGLRQCLGSATPDPAARDQTADAVRVFYNDATEGALEALANVISPLIPESA